MFLSVIIPTRNRAKYLAGALESLTKQTYPTDMHEVLVVDNGSSDNTREVCASFKDKIPHLQYFYEEKPGLHVGRHLGMRQARSEILVYADDDIEAFPTWLEAVAECFQDPKVVLAGGKVLPKFESEPPDWIQKMWERDRHGNRILGYLSILDLGDEKKEISSYYVFGCNFSIRKSILIEAGGFHPDAMPQELIRFRGDGETHVSNYIDNKAMKVLYQPNASIYHTVSTERMTFMYFCRRAHNEGISRSFADFRHAHNIGCSDGRKITPIDYVKTILSWIGRTAIGKKLNMVRKTMKMHLSGDGDLAQIYRQLDQAWLTGWEYHRNAMEDDPELRSYVLEEHYMG